MPRIPLPHKTAIRRSLVLLASAAIGVVLLAPFDDALAGRRRPQKGLVPAVIKRIEAPIGMLTGNVAIPFALFKRTGSHSDVEGQFGVDRNADGTIADDEFFRATEDRLDPRDTRRDRAPQDFRTSRGPGAWNAFVWRSGHDVLDARYSSFVYRRTDQGRLVPDEDHPGEFQFGAPQSGVKFRLRATFVARGRQVFGAWTTSEAFLLDNTSAPSLSIDSVVPSPTDSGPAPTVVFTWTGVDPNSEDVNDNGLFDPGEDVNGDGVFDQVQLGVAFDVHRLALGEDPARMTDYQLEQLEWVPCSRGAGGDHDSFREGPPGVAAPDLRVFGTPDGRTWTFVWDAATDAAANPAIDAGPFIVRGRCIDNTYTTSDWVVSRQPFFR